MFSPTKCSTFSSPFLASCFTHRLLQPGMVVTTRNRLNEFSTRYFSDEKFFSSNQQMPIGAPTFAEPKQS